MRLLSLSLLLLITSCAGAEPAPVGELAEVVFLEKVPEAPKEEGKPPLYRRVPADDARAKQLAGLLENEGSRFVRRLVHRAWKLFPPAGGGSPALTILLEDGGNHADCGYRLQTEKSVEDHPRDPFVRLDPGTDAGSFLLLHEGGHVVQFIARDGTKPEAPWTPLPHSTQVVTDPITAVNEGYAIHLETLWGHFGRDPARRAFYHHHAPGLGTKPDLGAETWVPLKDLLTFSQNWARYHDVRDGLPAFTGPIRPGDYLAYQFDPSRDRSRMKGPQALIASEGVVAAVLFWMTTSAVLEQGIEPGSGLDQPALLEAESALVRAIAAPPADGAYRPDLIDIVAASGEPGSAASSRAIASFLAITRGITARAALGAMWTRLYSHSVTLDATVVGETMKAYQAALEDVGKAAAKDPQSLRAALGPVLPVRAQAVELTIPALGFTFPLEFDLNAASEGELVALPAATPEIRSRILEARVESPFPSIEDFEKRTGTTLKALGLEPIPAPAK